MSLRKKATAMTAAMIMATPLTTLATAPAAEAATITCAKIVSITTRSYPDGKGGSDYYYFGNVRNDCGYGRTVRAYGYRWGWLKTNTACQYIPAGGTRQMSGLLEMVPTHVETC